MAHRWNACRQFACVFALHPPLGHGCDFAPVDAALGIKPGADPAVFRLCGHPVPLDGRGHHLQARLGLHGGNRRRCSGLLRLDRFGCFDSPYAHERDRRGHDRHRHCRVLVPAVPRRDSSAPGSFLLPRSPRLSPHSHRIRAHADERSSYRPHAGFGHGPYFSNLTSRSARDFCGECRATRADAHCPFDGRPSFRVFEPQFPRAGPARVCPGGALF